MTLQAWKEWKFSGGNSWTDWAPIDEAVARIERDRAGAYVLGLPGHIDLHRMLGRDPHGALDIGESGNLKQRIETLYRCMMNAGTTGHMAGWRIASLGLLGKLGIQVAQLRLSWCYANSSDESYKMEGRLLRIYLDAFGELPPLNYKFNWSSVH